MPPRWVLPPLWILTPLPPPPVHPKLYRVKLKVNKLTSIKTLLPLEYYTLPVCRPVDGPVMDHQNWGEFLAGDRIQSSPYLLQMKKDMFCGQLCIANLGKSEMPHTAAPNQMVKAIRKNYHNNWIVDNLPVASKAQNGEKISVGYYRGFPIGYIQEATGLAYVHNHVNIQIMYYPIESEADKFRVVGVTVQPFSIAHDFVSAEGEDTAIEVEHVRVPVASLKNPIESCRAKAKVHTSYEMITAPGRQAQPASGTVLFTYDVQWIRNLDIEWARRWDMHRKMNGQMQAEIHWLSITNSLLTVVILSALIAAILVRNLRRYNNVASEDESRAKESAWKLVHTDVFRPPSFSPMLLCICCGTGAQLLATSFFTIALVVLGFMSPARRGHLLLAILCLFVTMGSVNGYVTARLYKAFEGKAWQHAAVLTSLAFPGIAFAMIFLIDLVAWKYESSTAVPFVTILVLLVLWFGIHTPLVFAGAYIGFKQEGMEFPVNPSSIPRQIPDQPWGMFVPITLLNGGILPFGSFYVELHYIMASLWMERYYYVFGFLLLVFLISLITCAEITAIITYFQLCSEDYRWWWRSFANGGATALYFFAYSIVYFQQLEANSPATYILYFGYMALASLALGLLMGVVGVASSLWFNKVIFASIKIN